jgi:hypothetical protein
VEEVVAELQHVLRMCSMSCSRDPWICSGMCSGGVAAESLDVLRMLHAVSSERSRMCSGMQWQDPCSGGVHAVEGVHAVDIHNRSNNNPSIADEMHAEAGGGPV